MKKDRVLGRELSTDVKSGTLVSESSISLICFECPDYVNLRVLHLNKASHLKLLFRHFSWKIFFLSWESLVTPRCKKNNTITFVPKICHGPEKKRDTGKRKYWFESQSDTPFPTRICRCIIIEAGSIQQRKSMYKNLPLAISDTSKQRN